MALYCKAVTVQWHFWNGPDRPATSFHLSCEGFRQGDALAIVYFNVLAAKLHKKQLRILEGRGVLFAVADNVKILSPLEVMKKIIESFPTLAWKEASLTTQTVENRIFGQLYAQAS